MQTLKPTLTIDIWSDLVCPWCWIAKKRFEQGLNRFEFRDQGDPPSQLPSGRWYSRDAF